MNMLESADLVSQARFGRRFLELGEPLPTEWVFDALSFEQKQIVKIIAGTVEWR